MAGIIFSKQPPVLVTRGLSRRKLFAVASGAAAGVAFRSSPAMQDQATPSGTPEGSGGGGPEQLKRSLSHAPIDLLTPDEGNGIPFFYADLARQFESVGLEPPFSDGERPSRNPLLALYPLATASPAFERAADEAFTTAIGFQPLKTGQTLLAGTPPDQLTLFMGGMDLEQLPKAWAASGYELVPTEDGAEIWTVGETGDLDLDSTMGAFVMPSLNNAIVLENGVVMFAQTYDRLVSAIETSSAGAGSILEDEGIGAVVAAMPIDTVSAIAVTPEYVALEPERGRSEATPEVGVEVDEAEPMPAYRSFAMGITAGFMNPEFQPTGEGTPDASPEVAPEPVIPDGGVIFARLAAESEDDAALIAGIVETRWNERNSLVSNRPYAELMTIEAAEADGDVAAVDFLPVVQPSVWLNLLLQRDLVPFAPSS